MNVKSFLMLLFCFCALLSCKKDDNLVKFEGTYKGLWQMDGGNFPDSFVKISKIDKKGNLLFMESPGGTSAPIENVLGETESTATVDLGLSSEPISTITVSKSGTCIISGGLRGGLPVTFTGLRQ